MLTSKNKTKKQPGLGSAFEVGLVEPGKSRFKSLCNHEVSRSSHCPGPGPVTVC